MNKISSYLSHRFSLAVSRCMEGSHIEKHQKNGLNLRLIWGRMSLMINHEENGIIAKNSLSHPDLARRQTGLLE